MVTDSSRTLSSFEFCSEKASWLVVSWNSPSELCILTSVVVGRRRDFPQVPLSRLERRGSSERPSRGCAALASAGRGRRRRLRARLRVSQQPAPLAARRAQDRPLGGDRPPRRRPQIVEAMLEIGRALDLEVVPEGIETPEQLPILSELGCPLGQGFLFARPRVGDARARGRPRARARRG